MPVVSIPRPLRNTMKTRELSTSLRRALCSLQLRPRPRPPCPADRPPTPVLIACPFSATRARRIAAPEIDFDDPNAVLPQGGDRGILERARVVPASPSYFTGKPEFTDNLLQLQALLRKHQTLPVLQPGHAPRVAWKTLEQYKRSGITGAADEPVKAARYHKILNVLHRLNYIHPSLMPDEVREAMQKYKRDINPYDNVATPQYVDEHGRAYGVGRRKTSSAKAYLVEGEGDVLVNGKSLTQMFGRLHDRESAIWALKATGRIDKYNVWAVVKGGGVTGQAEALTLAVAKALMVHEPMLKPALRRGTFTFNPLECLVMRATRFMLSMPVTEG